MRPPARAFPLVRHLSYRLTRAVYRWPLSANHLTALSLAFGLLAAWCFAAGDRTLSTAGALALIISYVLDNSDGEIALLKNMRTSFGDHFDTFVDWVVNAAFFTALGVGTAHRTGEEFWLWCGYAAAAGATINYVLDMVLQGCERRARRALPTAEQRAAKHRAARRVGPFEWRAILRSDFCFIVAALCVLDLVWVLLPAGAVGAQAYWMTQFMPGARGHHV